MLFYRHCAISLKQYWGSVGDNKPIKSLLGHFYFIFLQSPVCSSKCFEDLEASSRLFSLLSPVVRRKSECQTSLRDVYGDVLVAAGTYWGWLWGGDRTGECQTWKESRMIGVLKFGDLSPLPSLWLTLHRQSEHLRLLGVVWMNVLRAQHRRRFNVLWVVYHKEVEHKWRDDWALWYAGPQSVAGRRGLTVPARGMAPSHLRWEPSDNVLVEAWGRDYCY